MTISVRLSDSLRPLLAAFAAALLLPATPALAAMDDVIDFALVEAAVAPVAPIGAPAIYAGATPAPAPVPAAPSPILLAANDGADCPAILRHSFARLQGGEPQSLCQFRGKVLLVVNTASYCGYTKQYESLEAMYRKYRDRGLVVVGFPSNDFSQEPGSNREIAEFCRSTYGVQFPMFEKGSVAHLASNPFYAALAAKAGEAPRWNFHKYVIDRSGSRVASFRSAIEPDARDVVSLIERLLAEKAPAAAG